MGFFRVDASKKSETGRYEKYELSKIIKYENYENLKIRAPVYYSERPKNPYRLVLRAILYISLTVRRVLSYIFH